jgi:hypothetical protein
MSMALCAASLDAGVDVDLDPVPVARRADAASEPSDRRAEMAEVDAWPRPDGKTRS